MLQRGPKSFKMLEDGAGDEGSRGPRRHAVSNSNASWNTLDREWRSMGACHVHRVADMLELSPRRMNIDAPIPMPSSSHKKKRKNPMPSLLLTRWAVGSNGPGTKMLPWWAASANCGVLARSERSSRRAVPWASARRRYVYPAETTSSRSLAQRKQAGAGAAANLPKLPWGSGRTAPACAPTRAAPLFPVSSG